LFVDESGIQLRSWISCLLDKDKIEIKLQGLGLLHPTLSLKTGIFYSWWRQIETGRWFILLVSQT